MCRRRSTRSRDTWSKPCTASSTSSIRESTPCHTARTLSRKPPSARSHRVLKNSPRWATALPRQCRPKEFLAQRGKVPNLRSLSMLLAAVFLILALARPRFGSIIGPPLPPGHDVALLIDVSRSMGAEDAVPNRLAVAIDAAESLISALAPDPANRVAIVVFAGRGVVRYPLTENLGAVVEVLHRLQPGTVRPGGTDLGAGLD